MSIKVYANLDITAQLPQNDIFTFVTAKEPMIDIAVITNKDEFFIPNRSAFIILNTDVDYGEHNFLDGKQHYIISYGFNSRATVTMSSAYDDAKKVICLQRRISTLFGNEIEPQEIVVVSEHPAETLVPRVICELVAE